MGEQANEIDLVDEIYGPLATRGVPEGPTPSPQPPASRWVEDSAPEPAPRVREFVPASEHRTVASQRRLGRFVLAFGLSAVATLILFAGAAVAISASYSNRVAPGVRIGSADVSGLTRDQVISRLRTDYAYLGEGDVTIKTPLGTASISYQQAGRTADVEFMADQAMQAGHSGNPIADAVGIVRSAVGGRTVPIVVRVDPAAVATQVHQFAEADRVSARDARAVDQGSSYLVLPSAPGSDIDEAAVSAAIVDKLLRSDAPAEFQAGGAFVVIHPRIGDDDAARAIAAAERMIAPLTLAWGGTLPPTSAGASADASSGPSASPTSAAPATPIPSRTFTIDSQTVRGWIAFGVGTDGKYGPIANADEIQASLAELSPKVTIAPVEPKVSYDSTGKPVSVASGKDGLGIDLPATTRAVIAYLNGLATGASAGSGVAMAAMPIAPGVSLESLSGMVIIGEGKGAWTTIFYPDVSNGNGANIRTPAKLLNGLVVPPGGHFSFLSAVSPVDSAHGYAMGGVILGGKSDHTGAMGGGICSASTTMFNAAARAGLQIDERHAHFYYIYRYPVGLDATVYSNGHQVWDLRWTNDTPSPIVIRAWTTYGSKSTITIQLWSLPLDRKVDFTPEVKENVDKAADFKQYVSYLKPGEESRAEYPTSGFDTSRTRTVTDSTGRVIHVDTWKSHYTRVDGLLLIGKAGPPPPTSTPTPGAPAPPPAVPAPGVTPTAAPRPRRSA
jgi:vancomycin resistance protein YoaR